MTWRFFALLQKNVLNRQVWRARRELRISIVTCSRMVERTYTAAPPTASPGWLTPIEYETIMTRPATQAA